MCTYVGWSAAFTDAVVLETSFGAVGASALVDGRKQICWRDLERMGESNDHIECRITTRALYAADVCAVQSRMVCELLLRRPPLGLSELANPIAKGHAMSGDRCHIGNAPLM